jgi:hypothetical protein
MGNWRVSWLVKGLPSRLRGVGAFFGGGAWEWGAVVIGMGKRRVS